MEQVQRNDARASLQLAFLSGTQFPSLFLFSQDIPDFFNTYKVIVLGRAKLHFGLILTDIVRGLRTERMGFDSCHTQDIFSTLHCPDLFEAHLSSSPVDTRGSSPGGKRQGRETKHSPTFGAEVKNDGAILPLYTSMA
jgi:hypothetical protein